jgi:peptide/nickel transport system substrate-binding protein
MASEPVRGGTLVIGIPDNPDRLDGHRANSAVAYWVTCGLIYNGLVSGGENYGVFPNLAQSWEIKEGGKVWDFKLHQGVKFHDGSELTAEVVKWNFDRAYDPKTGWVNKKDFEAVLERVEAVDKYTVRFYLKRPSQIFHIAPLAVGGRSLVMVSKDAVEKLGMKEFDNQPVGTGPFKLVEYVRDDHITLVRNENYFKKGLPYLDKIVIKILHDANTRFSALRTGEIHMMYDIPPEMVPMVEKTPGMTYVKSKPCSYVWLALNMHPESEKVGSAFFKDIRVRQAIGFAIDRDELVRLVVPGMGDPAYGGPMPTGNPFYHKVDFFKYDPERARKLLKEAGYSKLKFTLETNNSKARFVRALEVIKEQLSRVGIETEIQVFDKAAAFPRFLTRPSKFQASLEDYEFSLDASTYLSRYLPTGVAQNWMGWSNKEYDQLLEDGLYEGDFQKRKKLYDRAQEIAVREAPLIFLWYGVEDLLYNSKVKGYIFTPHYTHIAFEGVYFEK